MFDYPPQELAAFDKTLEPLLARAQEHAAEAEQLAMDATRLLSVRDDQLAVCAKQSFFQRLQQKFRGTAVEEVRQLAEMQRIGWRYIQILNERGLMQAHSMIVVKNNLLTLATKETETRQMLTRMADNIADRLKSLETTVLAVESQQNIHGWLLTLDTYDYSEQYPEKLRTLKIIRDFHQLKGSCWNFREIKYLQQALKDSGLPWKDEISLADFIDDLIDEIDTHGFAVYQKILTVNGYEAQLTPRFMLENIAIPSHKSLYKIAEHYDTSSDMVDILADELTISKKAAMKRILRGFIEKEGIDTSRTIPLRDLAVELLGCYGLAVQLSGTESLSHQHNRPAPSPPHPSQSLSPDSLQPAPAPPDKWIDGRYEISADGTEVIDHQTHLIWRRDIESKSLGIMGKLLAGDTPTDRFTFEQALKHAAQVRRDTGVAWRVPTIDELKTLVDRTRRNPSINQTAFPNTPSQRFWSSSPYVGYSSNAWVVNFGNGSVNGYGRNDYFAVRLVRGG